MRSVTSPPPSRWTSLAPLAAYSKLAPPSARSAPAQKARPAPVTMTALTLSSASVASKAAITSVFIWWVKAFSRSGRFSVMVATPSSTE